MVGKMPPMPRDDYRSRHRARRHAEAHDDEDVGVAVEVPDHPLIPRGEAVMVDTQDALEDVLDTLEAAGSFAYDTEFIGESTYTPVLCLIQVATSEGLWLIDPMAGGMDVTGVWELIADPAVRTIVHAGEQDLEPVVRHLGRAPANVFDTQIAAGFAAMAYPTSLSKLVGELAGVQLGKGLTFTDWSERPLSKKQKHYAADDVRYLPAVAAALDEDLEKRGHAAWAQAECDAACAVERHTFDLDRAVKRTKGAGGLDPDQRPVIEHLVSWRDAVARERDLPPRALVKDEALVAIARKRKLAAGDLGDVKFFPRSLAAEAGADVVAAWAAGREAGKGVPRKRGKEPETPPSHKFAATSLHALFAAACHARGLDPDLICKRTAILDLATDVLAGRAEADEQFLDGWRDEACGDMLQDLLAGATVKVKWDRPAGTSGGKG